MKNFDLDLPLLELRGSNTYVHWTLRNAVEGLHIFGGIGSGKTSGSGRTFAVKYLSAGFGGLVLTVKPDDKKLWEEYCRLSGRSDDLIIVEPSGNQCFNFLDYESRDGATENIVHLLKTVLAASNEIDGGHGNDRFWDTALDMLLFNIVDLCRLADGNVTVQRMFDIVQSIPQAIRILQSNSDKANVFLETYKRAQTRVRNNVDAWQDQTGEKVLSALLEKGNLEEAMLNEVEESRIFKFIDQFFIDQYLNLSEKTRSIIDFSFSGFLFRLLREPVYSLFCSRPSTFTPDDCRDGKIILLNLPVKVYHKIGRDCQILFKLVWQRAMEKREADEAMRPVFLWADEAQNFLHEEDPKFLATARSCKIATVFISQNLPNYLASMGGDRAENRVYGLLGTFGSKIFHANADTVTNRFASDIIGDIEYIERSDGSSIGGQFSMNHNRSLRIDRAIRPEEFAKLKTGGRQNEFKVDGYMHVQGNPVNNNRIFFKPSFNQNYSITI